MSKWVSLRDNWTLQDVQAGLNVIIAFLCAGAIFVLVRYCWLLAARRIASHRDVPAYSLLSLNTIGETLDVIWLLRYDLFSSRYKGLLLQVICVIILTIATLTSGFIARFSTRWGTVIKERNTNGTIAQRFTSNVLYAEVDTNTTLAALKTARFPPNQLLEYLPNPEVQWDYVADQWNSSWSMDCTYNRSTEIPNPRATGNCTDFGTEFPQVYDNYWDWTNPNTSTFYWQTTGWRNTREEWRDWLVFTHGVQYGEYDDANDGYNDLEMRTVTIYMEHIPWNTSLPTECNFGEGPIGRAFYTSCNCKLTRKVAGRSSGDLYYGANPDGSDLLSEVQAYMEHYGNRFRKESSRNRTVSVIEGEELAMFYQAYHITKDTIVSPFVFRKIDNFLRVPQVSIICLIICSIGWGFVIFGIFSYWTFVYRHWHRLDKTPQSKLDWMLSTIRTDTHDKSHDRQRLSLAMASGTNKHETLLMNRMDGDSRRSLKSTHSIVEPIPEIHQGEDGFDTPILGSNYNGPNPVSTWFPQQYERVNSNMPQQSVGRERANSQFASAQQQSPYMSQGGQYDTAYDPGRR